MSKHTPTPWEAEGLTIHANKLNHPKRWFPRDERIWVCQMITGTPSDEDYANAARIVACVNALAGIDDPAAFVAETRELLNTLSALSSVHPDHYRKLAAMLPKENQ